MLVGRTLADIVNNVLVDRRHGADRAARRLADHTASVVEAIGGFLLLLVFAYAISWLMAWSG